MSRDPDPIRERSIAGRLTQELKDTIAANMPERFKGLQRDRYQVATGSAAHLTDNDKQNIIIGLALKLTSKEIVQLVNKERIEQGLPPVALTGIPYYKAKFADLIDEVYSLAVLRIGEIYSYADKVVRISRINEMAEALRNHVMTDLLGELDDISIKKMNIYLRTIQQMNVEMGAVPLNKMIGRANPKTEEEDADEPVFTKEQTKDLIKQAMQERYSGQLPVAISEVVSFTDYTNCANGEQLGGVTVCWNDKMTENNAGSQCPVQMGKIKKCPKFLNASLLNNKDWLVTCREQNLTIVKIAKLVGCEEWDVDVRNRIVWYFKKFEILRRAPKMQKPKDYEETLDEVENGVEESQENVIEVD